MASGRFVFTAVLFLSACGAFPSHLLAEDTAPAEPKHEFEGVVNANKVFVRSRPSEDAYATMRLSQGTRITAVNVKGNWLQILPPDGSFGYVAKSFVILREDGTVGRTTKEVIVRAGSELNEMAAQPLVTLSEGEDVHVIGQHNEYFKIKPPKGSYLWINKQFVDPAPSDQVAQAQPIDQQKPTTTAPDHVEAPNTIAQDTAKPGPETQPSRQVATAISPPTTQPASTQPAFDAVAEFASLEQQFTDAGNKSIADQPLGTLLKGYQKVVDSDDLPSSMRRIAEIRMANLKIRNDARDKFLALKQEQKKAAEKQQSLVAERVELEERLKENDLQVYAALGTLRTSSLQIGQGTLYRLTDPASGRTVAYIRTNDAKYSQYLGQFIGVRGTIANDPQLKSVIDNPADVKPVDPADVQTKVAAQLVPPSLVKFPARHSSVSNPVARARTAPPAGNNTASTGGEEPQ